MANQQGFLATFRVDQELWTKFKDIAQNNKTNASALIVQYIEGVVSAGGISRQSIQDTDSVSIQDIDKLSIQDIDSHIDNKINQSLADGGIGEAIAKNYAAMTDQLNGVFEELQALKKQFEELKPTTTTPTVDVIGLLGIEDIILGAPYDLNFLNASDLIQILTDNKTVIEQQLKIKLNLSDPKYICRTVNKIIRALGYEIENKQVNKVETYWVKTK